MKTALGLAIPALLFFGPFHIPAAPRVEESASDLRESLRLSTVTAIELEIDAYTEKLRTAEEGTGPDENKVKFRLMIEDLEAERERFSLMPSDEYPDPVKPQADSDTVFDRETGYGPILPPVMMDVVIDVDGPLDVGSILPVEGGSRSGPFFHLSGILGGDAGVLKPGKRYRLTVCTVYRREYFGFIGSYYVYVSDLR